MGPSDQPDSAAGGPPAHTLILGGTRSGKSQLAERLATGSGLAVHCLVTASAGDDAELAARIARHRLRRPAHWQLVEEPLRLADALAEAAGPGRLVLVDCLSLWLTNLLLHPDPGRLPRERDALLATLPALNGPCLLVSNEGGLGVLPAGALARRYLDEAGLLHQAVAEACARVLLVVAGLPLTLKGTP